jgi:hypothetical protein
LLRRNFYNTARPPRLHCCGSAPRAFPIEAPFFLTEQRHYPRPRHPFLLTLTPACSHKGTSRFVSFSWLF